MKTSASVNSDGADRKVNIIGAILVLTVLPILFYGMFRLGNYITGMDATHFWLILLFSVPGITMIDRASTYNIQTKTEKIFTVCGSVYLALILLGIIYSGTLTFGAPEELRAMGVSASLPTQYIFVACIIGIVYSGFLLLITMAKPYHLKDGEMIHVNNKLYLPGSSISRRGFLDQDKINKIDKNIALPPMTLGLECQNGLFNLQIESNVRIDWKAFDEKIIEDIDYNAEKLAEKIQSWVQETYKTQARKLSVQRIKFCGIKEQTTIIDGIPLRWNGKDNVMYDN